MKSNRKVEIFDYDWVSILLINLLIGIGIVSIYSATYSTEHHTIFKTFYGKQLTWYAFSIVLIISISLLPIRTIKKNAPLLYLFGILLLLSVLVFGANINGNKSWFRFGSFGIQPAEFVKLFTVLGLAKLMSEFNFNIKSIQSFFQASLLILLPMALILLQPDLGSAIVFLSLFIVLYREGLSTYLFSSAFLTASIFILTIYFSTNIMLFSVIIISILINLFSYFVLKRKIILKTIVILLYSIGTIYATSFVFNKVLKQHQKNRIEIVLHKKSDDRGTGYNLKQALIAISSGGITGKGMLKGTQTNGDYIPEQHTDWILTVIGEQWGLVGTLLLVLLYTGLLIRLVFLAERQKQKFSRVLGYGVVSILFFHYSLNMLMVLGLFPTIGIPLPLLSYGGSSLWAFTLMLFVFLKFDAHRKEDW